MPQYKATAIRTSWAISRASFWPEKSIRCAAPHKYLHFSIQITSCLSDKNLQTHSSVTRTNSSFDEHGRCTEMCWLRPISIGKGRLGVDSSPPDRKFTYCRKLLTVWEHFLTN